MEENGKSEKEHAIGWRQRLTEIICSHNEESLIMVKSVFQNLVKGLPLSYLAVHYTHKSDLEIIGASPVFMEKLHYHSPEHATFDNVFGVPQDLLDIEDVKRALKNPFHRRFSIPLYDGNHQEILVYVTKGVVSRQDLPVAFIPKRKLERNYYFLLEMNPVGIVQRTQADCFKECKYQYPKRPSTPYEFRVKEQAQIIEGLNKKKDRVVLWELPTINL